MLGLILRNALGSTPGYRLAQRLLRRHAREDTGARLEEGRWHLDGLDVRGRTVCEFGAGSSLVFSLACLKAGAARVVACDLHRLIDFAQVEAAYGTIFGSARQLRSAADLAAIGLDYVAPVDAAACLRTRRWDLVMSTAVIEHIPPRQLEGILAAARGSLTDDGILSAIIDYRDHWSFIRPRLPVFHHYRLSRLGWALVNGSYNYQNGLRHSDILRLLNRFGFELVAERTQRNDGSGLPPRIGARYQGYARDDLLVECASIRARPRLRPGLGPEHPRT